MRFKEHLLQEKVSKLDKSIIADLKETKIDLLKKWKLVKDDPLFIDTAKWLKGMIDQAELAMKSLQGKI